MSETRNRPSAPSIRTADLSDDAELARLDRETWSPLHAVTPLPEPPYAPYFDARHQPGDVLVAEDPDAAGRLLGYVRLVPPTPLACNAHVLQINGLAVAEEARGRGLGRALVRAACDEARRRGARRLTLRVLSHNKPARTLYEAEGFVVEGVLPGEFHLHGEYVDDVLMGRPLTD
ncbi:GNAT family N-acetyltransferase [Streptomyces candidus]|uniref:Ribosomal protein S18 acetylase RimI-like enzyme n=1 Tax=Streptomyces candidus TaxID=67283 RepID=A0A7X0HA19_9ACTN|nr:GNAT family N-acetyltransferase [Streptomyces candidus]MBB6433836.1 ribosomal protein S18 acetylase RimI-like enzyme [Streptomyces candidus]GHH34377.1 N-acetyltransferase [Streptomyces candidus]